jgi:hypothetical protein
MEDDAFDIVDPKGQKKFRAMSNLIMDIIL